VIPGSNHLPQLTSLVGLEDARINHIDDSLPTASTSFGVDEHQETTVKNVSRHLGTYGPRSRSTARHVAASHPAGRFPIR
jgi:hypothetical protein